jgi:hypothetical protein
MSELRTFAQEGSSMPLIQIASRVGFLLAVSAAGGVACGTQASNDYTGDALFGLTGSVVIDDPAAPADVLPVVAYTRPAAGSPEWSGYTLADVIYRGEFPARFRLSIFEPPPEDALVEVDTPLGRHLRYAFGRLGAVLPDHPHFVVRADTLEASFCLGKECYLDRSRCSPAGNCYYEREHCTLPARYETRSPAYSACQELPSSGNVAELQPSPAGFAQYEDASCTETTCELDYEWCRDSGAACVDRGDGNCKPPLEDCRTRRIECAYNPDLVGSGDSTTDELDPLHWRERSDLTNCGLVTQTGNLDFENDPNAWLAGISGEVFVIYLPDGFDPEAFEEEVGVAAPGHAGYSLLVLDPANDPDDRDYDECRQAEGQSLIDAYNAEHGTAYVLGSVDAASDLGGELLEDAFRCFLRAQGEWRPDPLSVELTLHVEKRFGS